MEENEPDIRKTQTHCKRKTAVVSLMLVKKIKSGHLSMEQGTGKGRWQTRW
jgi:hypothetical protein